MAKTQKPNILFLVADQQQAATILSDSPCLMPNIDSLRSSGVTFTEARTVAPICSPARASLFTGRLPHIHGMVDNTHCAEPFRASFQSDVPTVSAHLQSHGYQTGYFGKWHVERSADPTAFGFDEAITEYHGRTFPRTLTQSRTVQHRGYNDRTFYGVHSEPAAETEERFFYDQAIDFIDRAKDYRPWCAFVSTNAPHDPYIAPQEFFDLYDPATLPIPESFRDDLTDKPGIYRRLRSVWSDLSPSDIQRATACYYALCSMVDAEVGRIIRTLEACGAMENTIVVYTSDHGDLMGGHGLFCKGVPAFEECYRIPMVVSWKGHAESGVEVDDKASILDLAPTIVDLAGLPPFGVTEGQSLAPAILGKTDQKSTGEKAERSLYAEFFGQRVAYTQRIVWKGEWKYVYNPFDHDELYNLETDPLEMKNLAADAAHKDILETMAREMWNWAKATEDEVFLESEYFMFRFAPVGPERGKKESIYNRGA